MKTKTFSLVLTSVLALIVLSGLASAASVAVSGVIAPSNVTYNIGTFPITFNLTNTGAVATTLGWVYTATQGATITFSQDTLAEGNSTNPNTESVTATVTLPNYKSGNIVINISGDASGTGGTFALGIITIPILPSSSLSVSSPTISSGSNSTTITITNTGNTPLTGINLNATGDFGVLFSSGTLVVSSNAIASLAAGTSGTVTVTANSNDISNLLSGSTTITASATGVTPATGTVTLANEFCEISNRAHLRVSIDDINNKGFGDEDNWYPLDEVEIDFLIENTGNEKIKDIVVEWGLYDTDAKDWVGKMYKESKFDLKSDDEKTITVTIPLSKVKDLESGNFVLYVRATGEDQQSTKVDVCNSDSESKDVTISSDFVVLSDIVLSEEVSCGSEVQISADVWNIGDSDEDNVYVVIYNKELGINKKVEIGDINSFDKEKLDTTITIPENAQEKIYQLSIEVYDDNDDIFVNDDDDKAIFKPLLTVSGSCTTLSKATVSAVLESGGKAGSPLVIKATIANTGTSQATYTINAANFADWVDSASVDTPVLVLGAGQTKDVKFTLDVKKGVSGEKTFNIEISSGLDLLVQQPVAVTIEKAGFFAGITGNVIGGDTSWYIWVIGALNVLLVVIIVVVALRIAKN